MYNDLYKAWKAEKTDKALQPLPEDFYKHIETYIRTLEENSKNANSHTLQSGLLVKEREVSIRLLGELRETRMQKIVSAIKNEAQIPATALTTEENTLLENMKKSLDSFNGNQTAENPVAAETFELPELKIVRFVQDIPEIVGVDLKMYGPFKKEDIASVPVQNAQALIRQGVAKQIEVRGIA